MKNWEYNHFVQLLICIAIQHIQIRKLCYEFWVEFSTRAINWQTSPIVDLKENQVLVYLFPSVPLRRHWWVCRWTTHNQLEQQSRSINEKARTDKDDCQPFICKVKKRRWWLSSCCTVRRHIKMLPSPNEI